MIFAKKDFSLKNILFTISILAVAVLINCIGSVIATKITFPLYLDSILTIGVTA